MSTLAMRKLAKHNIDRLPPEQLRSVVEFIGFLCEPPKAALPSVRPPLLVRLSQARRDARLGKLVPAGSLHRKRS